MKNDQLKVHCRSKDEIIEKLKIEEYKLITEVDEKKRNIQKLESQMQNFTSVVNDYEKIHHSAMKEIQGIFNRFEIEVHLVSKLKETHSNLTHTMDQLSRDSHQKDNTINTLKDNISILEKKISELTSQDYDKKSSINQLTQEIDRVCFIPFIEFIFSSIQNVSFLKKNHNYYQKRNKN